MASITIRNLDDRLKSKLRIRAAQHGRSMEEEARHILRDVLMGKARKATDLYEAIRRRIELLGGVDLEIPPRQTASFRRMIVLDANVLSELLRTTPADFP
jgi:plasmid stability protein